MGIETLAIAGLVGSAVSGVTGFIGAQQQAGAQEAQAKYQSQVARNNEIIAAQNAQYASAAASSRAQAEDLKNRASLGGILAGQAASGLDVNYGSPSEVRKSAEQIDRLDTQTIYSNALQQVRSDVSQARNFEEQARLSDFTAKNAGTAGLIGGFGSLISGASSFSDKWLRYSSPKSGIF